MEYLPPSEIVRNLILFVMKIASVDIQVFNLKEIAPKEMLIRLDYKWVISLSNPLNCTIISSGAKNHVSTMLNKKLMDWDTPFLKSTIKT